MGAKSKKSNVFEWKNLRLWQHQIDAIESCLQYYKSGSDKSHLVMLPTGSGKTAITAVLSRLNRSIANTLVVVPSEALRIQNQKEIAYAFWEKMGVKVELIPPKEILEIFPSKITDDLAGAENKQFVGVLTAQALLDICRNHKTEYEKLKELISLVIFDEGHREPALEWSNAIRDLSKPTILLSATPYRNDLKIFNLDTEKFYQLSYNKTIQTKIIRKIEVIEIEKFCESDEIFVKKITKFFESKKNEFLKNGVQNPKMIIRCETEGSIKRIVGLLREEGKSVIGIHENFGKKRRENLRLSLVKNVPTVATYEYWVHQYKLTEGIDDPSFCILSIFEHFGNSRALVQQIGRITRNPNKNPDLIGYVLTDINEKIKHEWETYLEFDRYIEKHNKLINIEEIIEHYIDLHPELYYLLNKFRKQIDFNSESLYNSYRYRLSSTLYKNSQNIPIDQINTEIIKELNELDYGIKKIESVATNSTDRNRSKDDVIVITYLKYANSKILLYDLFIEVELSFTFIKQVGEYLFYYDSSGRYSKYLSENFQMVDISKLENLLENTIRFNQITLLNTDLGKHSIRSKSLSAYSLNDIAPSLTDHQQIYSTANVARNTVSLNSKRRYVGFTKARVTDSSTYTIEFDDYIAWINEIVNALNNPKQQNIEYLTRFASIIEEPIETEPINILIDIEDIQNEVRDTSNQNNPINFDELCLTIEDQKFNWMLNDKNYTVLISYNILTKRYDLSCPELERFVLFVNDEKTNENLISYLNRTQSFRLIIKDTFDVYSFTHFYKPRFDIVGRRKDDRLPLLSIFESYPAVNNITLEKGSNQLQTKNNIWHKDTIFGLIARQGKGYSTSQLERYFNFDILICNDLDTEESDFIGCNTKDKRIVLMHAKALKDTRRVSASVFQEVCGQLIKNLNYLSVYSERDFNFIKWNNKWKRKDIGEAKRIVKGRGTGKSLHEEVKAIIKDPNATKEVWIFIGNGFDKTAFESKLKIAKEPELIQIIYLLTSTWEAASQVGAKLKVFC